MTQLKIEFKVVCVECFRELEFKTQIDGFTIEIQSSICKDCKEKAIKKNSKEIGNALIEGFRKSMTDVIE